MCSSTSFATAKVRGVLRYPIPTDTQAGLARSYQPKGDGKRQQLIRPRLFDDNDVVRFFGQGAIKVCSDGARF